MNFKIIYFLIALLLVGCSVKEDPEKVAKRVITVACANQVLADMVSKIAGDRATVFVFGDDNIHAKADFKKLKTADFVVILGEDCEVEFEEIKKRSSKKLLPVLDKIDPSLLKKDSIDPARTDCHFWFDDRLIVPVSEVISDKFSSFDPHHEAFYAQNTASFNMEVKASFLKFKSLLTHVPKSQRILVTTHDGFVYFGDLFSFETYGLWVSDEKVVHDRDISRLADFIVRRWVRYVFVEDPKDKFAEKLKLSVQEKGWEVEVHPIFIHNLALGTTASLSLLDALEGNVRQFRKLLGSDLDAMTIDDYLSSFD